MDLSKYTNESLLKMIHDLFNKDKGIPKNSLLRPIATEQYGIDTVENMSHLALHIAKEFSYRLEVALAPKPKVTKSVAPKAPKVSKQQKVENKFIKEHIKIFQDYPTLTKLPIFGWGRYYKYECAGDPFECYHEGSFEDIIGSLDPEVYFDRVILEKIDTELEEWDYTPSRNEVVSIYDGDERGGTLLYIEKDETGELLVKTCSCDSPE